MPFVRNFYLFVVLAHLQIFIQCHSLAAPVEQFIDVAKQVDGRHDASNHRANDEEWEDNTLPVITVVDDPEVRVQLRWEGGNN